MTLQDKMRELLFKVKELEADEQKKKDCAIAGQCYFLNADEVLSYRRSFGDARYPYSVDGLNLWAYTSGNVVVEESIFNIILAAAEGAEPNLCFFIGKKQGEGFFPVSVTGAAKLPFEADIHRFVVFTPDAAYYFVESGALVSCVRMFVDEKKNLRFTHCVLNTSNEAAETYTSLYMNLMLQRSSYEYIETKWYRRSQKTEDGFAISVTEPLDRNTCFLHNAYIARRSAAETCYSTTSRTDYKGGMHEQLSGALPLQNGRFENCRAYTEFNDTAVAGDLIPLTLGGGEDFTVDYIVAVHDDAQTAKALAQSARDADAILYDKQPDENAVAAKIPAFSFEGAHDGAVSNEKNLGYFLKNVFRQVEFCARAKNYAGPFIGIRDIFQQLEAAQLWIPEYSRGKIIEALNYIGDDGRAPRQYSYPTSPEVPPAMDLRPFVDQGVWIISTVYNYLAYTGDFSILEEECGYYKLLGNRVEFSDRRDSVLDHLMLICEYLTSKIDPDTGCLRILYGDWNDALDGLGKTEDEGEEFGSGVSVMASLQFYRNLNEMAEILEKLGRTDEAADYRNRAEKLGESLQKYAVVSNGAGQRKILHGWNDKREHCIGSFCDNDGENRDSLTATAYWVISKALQRDETLKKDILAAYDRLDSKYGLKTFEPYFAPENKLVGRITRLPKGTAENGAVYIHATLFAIWSLFEMGETERAFAQLYKILPVLHKDISTTPFVMPNSYIEDAEKGFDGESMSDWFTGSGCVLVKVLVWYVFGVRADLNSLTIGPAKDLPFDKTELTLQVKGIRIHVQYKNEDHCQRTFTVNGKPVAATLDEQTGAYILKFQNEELKEDLEIVVCD